MFGTSKLLNINEITKRTDNFFKLSVQLFYSISYPELALFTKGATYLTAQGFVRVEDDDKGSITLLTNTTSGSVRAVYDEWYWEKETNYVLQNNSSGGYDFTWGDMPMRNPQN